MTTFGYIVLLLVRSLATNSDGNTLYRLDISQSHVAVGNIMLSNLMLLMTCQNERWALIRMCRVATHDHLIEVSD